MPRSLLLLGSVCLLAVGCEPASDGGDESRNPRRKPVDVSLLRFDTPQHERRFFRFDKVAREFAGKDFQHRPYHLGGSFVSAVWARGVDFDYPCALRGPHEKQQDIHRITVQTIVTIYEPVPDQARSAMLRVEYVPADPDRWCVYLNYNEASEQPITGTGGWAADFFRWDPARLGIVPRHPHALVRERLEIPLTRYEVQADAVELPSNRSVPDSFLRYVRSAEAMRDAYLADLAELEKRTVAFLDEHKATKWVYDERAGRRPPPRHREPLTAEEEKAARAAAKRYFADRARLMRKHHRQMYAALRKSFPLERCWEGLAGQDREEAPRP